MAAEIDFIWRLLPTDDFIFLPRDISLRGSTDAARVKAWFSDERPLFQFNPPRTEISSAYNNFELIESISNTINYVTVQGGRDTIVPTAANVARFRENGVRTGDGVQRAFDLRYRWDRPTKDNAGIVVVRNDGNDLQPDWDATKGRLAWPNETVYNTTTVLEPGTGNNDVIWSNLGGSLIFNVAPPAKIHSFLIHGVIYENIQSAVRAPELIRRVGYISSANIRDASLRDKEQAYERSQSILQSAAPRQIASFETETEVKPTDIIRVVNSQFVGGREPFVVNSNFMVDLVKTTWLTSEDNEDIFQHQIQAFDTSRVTTERIV